MPLDASATVAILRLRRQDVLLEVLVAVREVLDSNKIGSYVGFSFRFSNVSDFLKT